MAEIVPAKFLRYNRAKVRLNEVLTQPYDKITPAMQERYYQASPFNLIRFELGLGQPGDNQVENRYTRASEFIKRLIREQILLLDDQPGIYVYSQKFAVPGEVGRVLERRGFVALGRLYDYDEKVVFRHEQTLSAPKTDRLNLLRASRVHAGQIFMLYDDPEASIDNLLDDRVREAPPSERMVDEYEVEHCTWAITDHGLISKIGRLMRDKRLIIADGHHRYETAIEYRNECRAGRGTGPQDYAMMTFINLHSPALVILPTHRVVRGGASLQHEDLALGLAKYFDLEGPQNPGTRELLSKLAAAGKNGPAFALVTTSGALLLTAKRKALSRELANWEEGLDVLLLHRLLLGKILGITEEQVRDQNRISYFRDAQEAIQQVSRGAQAAILQNPVPIKLMRDLSFSGKLMPQKSTDFYPKLLSGLTLYSLDVAEISQLDEQMATSGQQI